MSLGQGFSLGVAGLSTILLMRSPSDQARLVRNLADHVVRDGLVAVDFWNPLSLADLDGRLVLDWARTTPENAVAPEDQGGDANADAATAGDVVTELPARKKAKGLTARAIVALRGGDVAGAEPLLVRAVLVDPSLADAWRHLGIARAQLGDVEGTRRAYRKYLELRPNALDAFEIRMTIKELEAGLTPPQK